jgi:uncharacterized protein
VRQRTARVCYVVWLMAIAALSVTALAGSRTFAGHYARPELFRFFRTLFYAQQGLFVALLVALAGWLGLRLPGRLARAALYLLPLALLAWLAIWGIVHARFGIRLSLDYLGELLSTRGSATAVGLGSAELIRLSLITLLLIGGLAAAIEWTSHSAGAVFVRRAAVVSGLLFLPPHLAARTWVAYHIAHNQRAVLALDDGSPLPLRSEALIPGVRRGRLTLPNLSDPVRTAAYLRWAKEVPPDPVPRPLDVLWIVIESFRADAIGPETTPYLFAHRNEFQLRLDQNHWSGGNATRAGVFTMFSGVAAYHANEFREAGVTFPLLRLLAARGYRVRIGKATYFNFGDLRPFVPPEALLAQQDPFPYVEGDLAMVQSFLADYAQPVRQHRFDILAFESTHWPYAYPAEHAVFQPAVERLGLSDYLLPEAEMEKVRNRYRNSSHFADAEIGKVLERLRGAGALTHTIVLVTGDHGEEFRERGQLAHAGGMNDFQGRVPLWIHVPDRVPPPIDSIRLTTSLDDVPTLLELLGFQEDVLRTQGVSLLDLHTRRQMLVAGEQGIYFPQYLDLVSDTYLSRWRQGQQRFLFSGVERRDGLPVTGDAWWHEVESWRSRAALGYEILPDVAAPLRHFDEP